MASESDKLLVQQIRAGDERAWDTLISRYEGRLIAYVQRRLRDRPASEDVVQETFVGFLNSLPNFDDSRELQTYLFTIASYKLTDHLRKSGRNPLRSLSEGNEELLGQQHDEGPTASSRARSDERKELEQQALARCLAQMLRQWREKGDWSRLKVMELLWVAGWANRDVAAKLGVSEQQVANYRFAATKKLTELVRGAGLSA
ncbi:MAG: RNA polymerase sigma factor, partial [Gemmataceae bacterium]